MSIKFIEPLLVKIKTILQNNLPDKLDIIDIEKADFVLIDPIDYFLTQKGHISEYPTIEIYPLDSPGNDFSYHAVNCRHEIAIKITAIDTENDNIKLTKRIMRYQRAIIEVIKATDNLEDEVDLCEYAGFDAVSSIDINHGAYLASGIVYFTIHNKEIIQ